MVRLIFCLFIFLLSGEFHRGEDDSTAGSNKFGPFRSAHAISLTPSGSILVVDQGKGELLKLSANGDLLGRVGGFGWSDGAFDRPADCSTPNDIDIYVADENNHRVQRFDRALNFVSLFSGKSESGGHIFGYPKSVSVTHTGILFLVDHENKRVLRIRSGNEIDLAIGGTEAGTGRLHDPSRVRVIGDDYVVVLDEGVLRIYDIFGNYLSACGVPNDSIRTFTTDRKAIYAITHTALFRILPTSREMDTVAAGVLGVHPIDSTIVDAAVRDDTMYVLTHRTIWKEHITIPGFIVR